jgi:hypothetical protein
LGFNLYAVIRYPSINPTFSRLNFKKVILGKVNFEMTKMKTEVQIDIQDIDHLGIIAGIVALSDEEMIRQNG